MIEGKALPEKDKREKKKALRTVIKFGGSSLATAERLKEVAALVKFLVTEEKQSPIMVCSAMGKSTNNLLNAGDFALKDGKVRGRPVEAHYHNMLVPGGMRKHTMKAILCRNAFFYWGGMIEPEPTHKTI